MGFSSAIFELHAVVDAFLSSKVDESKFDNVIQECRLLCQRSVQFSVCFVGRQAHKAAHALAREAYVLACPFYSIVVKPT